MMRILCRLICVFGLSCFMCDARAAIVLGLLDDFQSGTTEGWMHNQVNPNSPANVANAGPNGAGDNALRISSSGAGGAGSRYLAFNSATDWTGSYTAAGVTGIQFQVNNTGTVNLNLRLALNGPGGWFVTTPIVVNTGGGWLAPRTFNVSSGDLLAVGGTDVAATLANVSQAQVMSAAALPQLGGGRPRGDSITGLALFDNFTAVPEPSLFGVLGLTSLAALRTRRRPSA